MKAERDRDPLLDSRAEVLAGDQLHHASEQVVAVVAVGPLHPRRRDWRRRGLGREQVGDGTAGCQLRLDGRKREAVPEAAGVVEKFSEGYLIAVGHAGNPVRDMVVKRDPPLPDQL